MQYLVESHSKTSLQLNLTVSTYKMFTLCSYNPSSKCDIYLWDAVLLFNKLGTIIMQGCVHLAQSATTIT